MSVFVCISVGDALSCSDVMHLPGKSFSLGITCRFCAPDACAVIVMNKHKYVFLSLFVFRLVMHLVVQT